MLSPAGNSKLSFETAYHFAYSFHNKNGVPSAWNQIPSEDALRFFIPIMT